MDKKIIFRWLAPGLGLFAAAIVLFRFAVPILPYVLAAASAVLLIIGFVKLKPNWAVWAGTLSAMALVLRFAARGYAWWAYSLLFVAALIVAHRFLPGKLWRVLLVLVCIGLAYFCFVESFVIRNAKTDKDPERDYLIVLGAAVYGDQPSLTLVRRLEGALDYLNRYPDSVDRVLKEDRATSTKENLEFSFDMIRQRGDEPAGKVAIVSSAYHLYRAKLMARMQGVEAAGVAAPWGYFFVMLNYFIREAFGVTHLWVFGW